MTKSAPPSDIRSVLARTAAYGIAPDHQRLAQGSDDALGHLLDCIETCMLPRDLAVSDGATPRLRIAAAGGSLLRILEVSDPARHGFPASLIGRPLHSSDTDDVEALSDALRRLCAGLQKISVDAQLPERPPDPVQSGVPASQLLKHAGLVRAEMVIPDKLDFLISAAEEVLLAVYSDDGETRSFDPGFGIPAGLIAALDRHFAGPDEAATQLSSDDLLLLRPAEHRDLVVGLVRSDAGKVALILDAASLGDIAAFWSDLPHAILRPEG